MRHLIRLFVLSCAALVVAASPTLAVQKNPAITSASVQVSAAGASSTQAYLAVENPDMYDHYLVSGTADNGTVEFRDGDSATPTDEVTIPHGETLYMDAKGVHIVLKGLSKPIAVGDSVTITVTTEAGIKLTAVATAKAE